MWVLGMWTRLVSGDLRGFTSGGGYAGSRYADGVGFGGSQGSRLGSEGSWVQRMQSRWYGLMVHAGEAA